MISRLAIEERVREWQLGEHVVEKDFALGWLLWAIGSDPVLGKQWVFKGGTCLKKCYVETWRFSEDLDFTVVPDGPVAPDEVLALLRPLLELTREASGIDFLAGEPKLKPVTGGEAGKGSVYYRGPRQTPTVARINLDLSRIERVVLAPVRRRIEHLYPDALPDPGTVLCYAFEEVFAEKIRAMGERGRPRDLYDIVNLFRRTELRDSGPRVREVLLQKCANKSIPVPTLASLEVATTRIELESEWENMLRHQLPALPPLGSFWAELPALFAWLEGAAEVEMLEPLPVGVDEDTSRPLPTSASTWGFAFPMEAIRFAAANRLCVELDYDGSVRLIEPYSLRHTKAGHIVLHARRVIDKRHGSYRIDRIQGARVTQQSFKPAWAVELSAIGPLVAPDTYRPSEVSGRASSSTKNSPRFEVECPICHRVFERSTRNSALNPHKSSNGRPCRGRRGSIRLR